MIKAAGYAAHDPKSPLAPIQFERRTPGPRDVQIDIQFCGICHSDLHTARNEWQGAVYPVIPGHEIVGRVVAVGSDVKKFAAGQTVGVGCMVDSCRTCSSCERGLEQYCLGGTVFTYNSPDKHTGKMTYGGYSTSIVVDEAFVLKMPGNLALDASAPLLCAGITMFSPLRHWKVDRHSSVAIVGLGGLGHMGVKIARAMGAQVTVITTSSSKAEDARRLGAHNVINSRNEDEMKKAVGSQDFIINTVAASHNLDPYLELLRLDGTMCLVGAPEHPHPSPSIWPLITGRRSLAGSIIGGVAETQEMLDFCGAHNIVSDIEMIPMQKVNEAWERMVRSDVKYRFVIDMASMK